MWRVHAATQAAALAASSSRHPETAGGRLPAKLGMLGPERKRDLNKRDQNGQKGLRREPGL